MTAAYEFHGFGRFGGQPLLPEIHSNREGGKSVRRCSCSYNLDMLTLVATRGRDFPCRWSPAVFAATVWLQGGDRHVHAPD